MKKTILFAFIFSSFCFAASSQEIGDVLTKNVILTSIEYGDMSIYIGFKDKDSDDEFSFDWYSWIDEEPSLDNFAEVYSEVYESKIIQARITMIYAPINEMEYQGFEIGSVETGNKVNVWVLTDINLLTK